MAVAKMIRFSRSGAGYEFILNALKEQPSSDGWRQRPDGRCSFYGPECAYELTGSLGRVARTESAMVVGSASASPSCLLKRIDTVLDTPRSCIVTP